jgi:hypothetical protein
MMALEKELRIIVGSNDIILLLCKKRNNFDRKLESDGQTVENVREVANCFLNNNNNNNNRTRAR